MRHFFTLIFVFSGAAFADCKATAPNQAVYPVKGMTCQACVDAVGGYFGKQKAVAKAEVDLAGKCMVLSFREQMKLTEGEVAEGLEKLGFELASQTSKSK